MVTGLVQTQAIIGIVAKDEEGLVGQPYAAYGLNAYKRPLEGCAGYGGWGGDGLRQFAQLAGVERAEGVYEVVASKVVGVNLALHQTAGGKEADAWIGSVGQ